MPHRIDGGIDVTELDAGQIARQGVDVGGDHRFGRFGIVAGHQHGAHDLHEIAANEVAAGGLHGAADLGATGGDGGRGGAAPGGRFGWQG